MARKLPPLLSVLMLHLLLNLPPAAGGAPARHAAGADEAPVVYRVRAGDHLLKIARRLGVTLAELQQDNGLDSDLIHVGQALQIRRVFHKLSDRQDLLWQRPCELDGARRQGFGHRMNGQGFPIPHTGVDLAQAGGAGVLAPADGVVRYVGEREGFGMVLILGHAAGFSTVLAPLDPDALSVAVGDLVLSGDRLGRLGAPVEHQEPYLHIELRRGTEAIDPERLLR